MIVNESGYPDDEVQGIVLRGMPHASRDDFIVTVKRNDDVHDPDHGSVEGWRDDDTGTFEWERAELKVYSPSGYPWQSGRLGPTFNTWQEDLLHSATHEQYHIEHGENEKAATRHSHAMFRRFRRGRHEQRKAGGDA